MSWVQVAQRWAAVGASCSISVSTDHYTDGEHPNIGYLSVSLRVLDEKFKEALEIFREKWYNSVFTERSRAETLCHATWGSMRSLLSRDNHVASLTCASSGLRQSFSLNEYTGGLRAWRYSKLLAEDFDGQYPSLVNVLDEFSSTLRKLSPVMYSYLGPESNRQVAIEFANSFAKTSFDVSYTPPGYEVPLGRRESLGGLGSVSGCARVYRSPYFWEEGGRELSLFVKMLTDGYLWDELRVKGGAYGVICQQNSRYGTFRLVTTQDPSPQNTFRIFDTLGSLPMEYSEREITDSIMAALKGLLKPCRQNNAVARALEYYLCGLNDEYYEKKVSDCLSITGKRLRESVRGYFASNPVFNDCVAGPEAVVSSLGMSRLTI